MSDHEPYVADPEEPRPRPRLFRMQPAIVVVLAVLLVAALVFLFLRDRAEQDPSFEVPDDLLEQPEPDAA